jgi:hypothetical protein
MSEAPEPICDLAGVLRALRNASGALSAQGDQIDQMKGMFGDEDGTIADAVEAGEESGEEIEAAIVFVKTLIEAEAFDAAVADVAEADSQAHAIEIAEEVAKTIEDARAGSVVPPDARTLCDMARDIRDELVNDLQSVEEAEDAEVVLSSTTAERVVGLLIGAALLADDAANPVVPDVLINCYGGMVQDVIVVEGQPRVRIFVEDNDLEGKDPDRDNDLVLLQDENPEHPDFHADLYTTHGDAFDGNGRRWSSLRAEADRLHTGGVRADLAEDDGPEDAQG